MQQILIIGNGFDMACGLPTSYYDFFNWRFNKLEENGRGFIDQFNELVNVFSQKVIRELYMESNIRYSPDPTYIIYDGKKLYSNDLLGRVSDAIDVLQNSKISFWDMYFYINKRTKADWYVIENEICDVVTGNIMTENSDDILQKLLRVSDRNGDKEIRELLHHLYYTVYLEKRASGQQNKNMFEIMLTELKQFEENFRDYIDSISEKVTSDIKYKKIYTQNYNKLINHQESTYIINFNYTSIVNFLIETNPGYVPREINVHGRFDDNIILGIDQKDCDVNSEEYIFSKTYRRLQQNTSMITLPPKADVHIDKQKLVFYGHSLSNADYSYFQSLFDLYDIYNQTSLEFLYSIYDESKRYEIQRKVFHSIAKLIMNYGATMDNKDHGRNLLHKMLLEGRIQLKEVVMDKMDFSL